MGHSGSLWLKPSLCAGFPLPIDEHRKTRMPNG